MKSKSNWFKELFAEAKKHLSPEQIDDYLFAKNKLSDEEMKFIKNHLSACTRCNSQVTEVKNDIINNNISQVSLPTLEQI